MLRARSRVLAAAGLLVTVALTAATTTASAQHLDAEQSTALITANLAPIAFPTTPPSMSPDCKSSRVAGDRFRKPLRGLRRALNEGREPRVLAIGSSSTVGVGASRPTNAYIARLESNLEQVFAGREFSVVGKGMSGEVAEGQSARMKETVAEVRPDLVLWQVGTNDAIRHVDIDTFKNCLRRTLGWLRDNKFDVVMIDPQFSEELTKDAFYSAVVNAIAEVASEQKVLLVDRFEAMRELSKARGDSFYLAADNLHLNDNGHRCMAEQLARAIVAGVLLADGEANNVAVR